MKLASGVAILRIILVVLFLAAFFQTKLCAQYTASSQTNIISGVVSNWDGDYYIGSNSVLDALQLINGAALYNNQGLVGYAGNNNGVLVAGNGSLWSSDNDLYVGYYGDSNSLIIADGGTVADDRGYIGLVGTNNSVEVSGSGSTWNNQSGFSVGYLGSGNSLVVSNGGMVINGVIIGFYGDNNSMLIAGSGSLQTNDNGGGVTVGASGDGNSLIITNGGAAFSETIWIGINGGASNRAVITGNGSVWSNQSSLLLGLNGSNNTLVINDGAVVVNGDGQLGWQGTNNNVLVGGNGTVWSNANLFIGPQGGGNALVIKNGGLVVADEGWIGYEGSSNTVAVSDIGTEWHNEGDLRVGAVSGDANSLIISDGGAVINSNSYIGYAGVSNCVLVSDSGSIWTNEQGVYVGEFASRNSLIISNGGVVASGWSTIGYNGSSNSVLISGIGSLWRNEEHLYIGDNATANSLVINSGGTAVSSSLVVGFYPLSANNLLTVNNGNLIVTNASCDGALEVYCGTFTLNGGTVMMDRLVVTNGLTSVVKFIAGTLVARGTIVSNDQLFAIGDGTNAATFHLAGGIHSFANGLQVRSNSVLSGCGTINGAVIVDSGGMVLADCGGTLTFAGGIINNGIMHAENGSALESYGAVVNNGIIDIMDGATNFHSAFINNGIAVEASYFRAVSIAREGNDISIAWTTVGGRSYIVEASSSSCSNNFSALNPMIAVTGSSLGMTNYIENGGATNTPTRFYRVRLLP